MTSNSGAGQHVAEEIKLVHEYMAMGDAVRDEVADLRYVNIMFIRKNPFLLGILILLGQTFALRSTQRACSSSRFAVIVRRRQSVS